MIANDGVIYASEVGRLLGVSASTLERLLRDDRSGIPAPYRLGPAANGRRRYWRRADIMGFLSRKASEAQRSEEGKSAQVAQPRSLLDCLRSLEGAGAQPATA